MNEKVITNFKETLLSIANKSSTAWVYLPDDKQWGLDSKCAVLESEEVPPELEDEPDAGIPEIAKHNKLIQVLPVTVVQDIVTNALEQKPDATVQDLFNGFLFYYKHDAFADLE
jgi:hypothetical protein